jgi:aspartyl aminopeptidase
MTKSAEILRRVKPSFQNPWNRHSQSAMVRVAIAFSQVFSFTYRMYRFAIVPADITFAVNPMFRSDATQSIAPLLNMGFTANAIANISFIS